MPKARLVSASLTHVGWLSRNLREIDRRECEAFGRSPKDALRMSLRTSLHALTALNEQGKPVAMFGVTPTAMLTGTGSPWFLGSDEVFRYAKDLLTLGPKIIGWFHETFPLMENLVSSENGKAIRLLKAWGADVGTDITMVGGVEFVPFVFRSAIQGVAVGA